jgi:hypothetical protein
MICNRSFVVGALLAFAMLAENGASAQNPTFTTPDAALPAAPGTGLSGAIWSNDDIGPVDDIAAARAYIGVRAPETLYTATVVDYPNGTTGIGSTDDPLATMLGVDAASLSDPAVGTRPSLNSIFQIQGFLRVETAGTLTLGVGSDDGSELRIQGTLVQNNDGLHDFPGAAPVAIDFTAPGLYALEILFFESQSSGWGLEFYQGAAGAGTPVPTALLYPSPVPEPATAALAAIGLVAAMTRRKRRHA